MSSNNANESKRNVRINLVGGQVSLTLSSDSSIKVCNSQIIQHIHVLLYYVIVKTKLPCN